MADPASRPPLPSPPERLTDRQWQEVLRHRCDCAGPEYHQTGKAECAVSLLLSARTATPPKTAWLIHGYRSGQPLYWTGLSMEAWSENPNEAVRFARKFDAEKCIPVGDSGHFVTEHTWMSNEDEEP